MSTLFVFIASVIVAGAFCLMAVKISEKKLQKRLGVMERDLQAFSDVMASMADVQTKTFQQCSSRFEDLEERIMDLSVPSPDSNLPLERRHKVLALARQGAAVDDIAKRLKTPVGEAELILNLRKYLDRENLRSATTSEQARPHV